MYSRLLIEMFKFVSMYLSRRVVPDSIMKLYKGLLRLLLVILHDFPDFICDYYYAFCDNIAPNCLQLRNLILSAFPREMVLPCPFDSDRHKEFLANRDKIPQIFSGYKKTLQETGLLGLIDSYVLSTSAQSKVNLNFKFV